MSELNERRWAVVSERGREGAGLSYEEAAGLVGRLRAEGLKGLCVITEEAASRLPQPRSETGKSTAGGGAVPGAKPDAAGPKSRTRRKNSAA